MTLFAKPLVAIAALAMFSATAVAGDAAGSGAMTKPAAGAAAAAGDAMKKKMGAGSGAMTHDGAMHKDHKMDHKDHKMDHKDHKMDHKMPAGGSGAMTGKDKMAAPPK